MSEFTWRAGRWHARWIWAASADAPSTTSRSVVLLRHEVDLTDVPEVVAARWFATARAAVWVNGVEAGRGPVRGNPRRWRFEEADLAPLLRPGRNVISAIAWSYPGATPWFLPQPVFANDLYHGGFVLEADLGDRWLVTDERWTATALPGWGTGPAHGVNGRGVEFADLADLPEAWDQPGGEWPAAIVRRASTTGEPGRCEPPTYPGGPFGARPISPIVPADVVLAPASDSRSWDAGRVVAGTLVAEVSGPPGATVTLRATEPATAASIAVTSEHDTVFAITCDGTRRTVESLEMYGLRAVEVRADDGAVLHGLTVRERLYPVTGDATFRCSDPRLEEIWAVGRRTVSICSHDAYVDCPTREQRAWIGDAVVHQMVDLTTNADWGLATWYPQLAATPRPDGMLPMAVGGDAEQADFTVIPDWALHWVHGVWNLYRFTGDREAVAELLPVVEGVVRWFERFVDDDGLPTDVFGWVIVDWSSVYTEGTSAALCGLWGRALHEFAEMSDWLGDDGRGEWARATHARLAAGFERLWDGDRRRYADSRVGDVLRPMASQHGQAAAIVGRLAPADRWPRLIEVLTDDASLIHATFSSPDGPAPPNSDVPVGGSYLRTGHPAPWWDVDRQVVRAQPFFRYVVHDALAAAGRADLIAAALLDWTVLLERSATSWAETWFGGTISHGWSSTPTRDLMTRVLGVSPAEPGFAVADVDPSLGPLAWAEGAVPCGGGRVVRLRVHPDRVSVDSPIPFRHAGVRYEPGRHEIPRV